MEAVSSWTISGFGVLLIGLSALLTWSTERSWRRNKRRDISDTDWTYFFRQRRRRLNTNIIISIVGFAMLGGSWIVKPLWFGIYWFCVVLLVFWIIVLAGVDFLATRAYYRNLRDTMLAERRSLEKELYQLQTSKHNGKGTHLTRHD